MNERELIARLQKRDEAAFEELIRQYEKKVYTLCFRMCGNSEDAEEAAQDAFLALWRGIDRFRQESSLSTWIYTEIAESASIELGTVKSRISRGRSLLRNFLSGNGNFFEIASSKVTECNREEMSAK